MDQATITTGTEKINHEVVMPEQEVQTQETKPAKEKPSLGVASVFKALGISAGVVAAAYAGLCTYAANRNTIWPGMDILGQDLGGLTVEEATKKLDDAVASMNVDIYLYNRDGQPTDHSGEPDASIPISTLGIDLNTQEAAQRIYDINVVDPPVYSLGWRFLTGEGQQEFDNPISLDPELEGQRAQEAAASLSYPITEGTYDLVDSELYVTLPIDGRDVSSAEVQEGLHNILDKAPNLTLDIPYSIVVAETMSAEAIHEDVYNRKRNAYYDKEIGDIGYGQQGATFDIPTAQSAINAGGQGETIHFPVTLEDPAITAAQLREVIFRDVLGEATTSVGGSAARVSNVRLAASSINGVVINSGEVFSYNGTVGQRTAAKGYRAAPAYVQGQTVNEIGGGVCQPSSTLYLASLRSNMEITERTAHRYVPSYIPAGMDATVSWGGPDYKFTNNTDYPVKIVTSYHNGRLTVQLVGTKVDDTTVKMTNKCVSTTPWTTVYRKDSSLASGTQRVSVTPYTGYRYNTYRNIYDGNGNLISSEYEATSDYKVRNKVVLTG